MKKASLMAGQCDGIPSFLCYMPPIVPFGWILQLAIFFLHRVWYNFPVSTSGQIRLRLARDQKAGGVVPTGTDAFFPAEVPSAPVHPDTVTHEHGDTVAIRVASVYACLVVAVYGDGVLS